MRLCELREQDLRGLDRLADRVARASTWDDCGSLLASGVRDLIDSEYCIYNETNPSGTEFTRQHVTEHVAEHESMMPVFYAHLGEHPILKGMGFEGLFSGVAQIDDFMTMREYHSTGLYTDFYRHIGVDHQVLTGLGVFGGVPVICCAHRDHMAFTSRECQVFMAMRLKLGPVLQRKAEETIARQQLAELILQLELHTGLTGLHELTLAEVQVAEQILMGRSYSEIAQITQRSPRTVEKQAASLLKRLGLERRAQLEAVFATPLKIRRFTHLPL